MLAFARAGADGVVHDDEAKQAAAAPATGVRRLGRACHPIAADLAARNHAPELVHTTSIPAPAPVTRLVDHAGTFPHGRLDTVQLDRITRHVALSLAPEVRASAIPPGEILQPDGTGPAHVRRLAHGLPLPRHGGPADIAAAASDLAVTRFVTGQAPSVDRGQQLGRVAT